MHQARESMHAIAAVPLRSLTMSGPVGETGCVFMRWKEKFLVPDHRVKDINGASFAGEHHNSLSLPPYSNPFLYRILLRLRRVQP